jgi:SpoVK/Ycf46/Vps4 family AAA+-type ATPase
MLISRGSYASKLGILAVFYGFISELLYLSTRRRGCDLMATAKQIVALLQSHLQGNSEQFLSIALQVAASEARQGRRESADEIKRLIDKSREQSLKLHGRTAIPLVRPRGELESALSASYPKTKLDEMVLPSRVRSRLDRIIRQQRQRNVLREHAKTPISRLLLIGPSGTGKTMTASALAGELHLPLFRIQLDSLINRFMGETASKLRLIFDQAAATRGVYLFDEFDALGAQRALTNDVGEMRRVLNSFLQFLEEIPVTDSLVVGATNHPELLDRALVRRFGEVLEYGLPTRDAARMVMHRRLGHTIIPRPQWNKIISAAKGLSQAEIATAADEAVKEALLNGDSAVTAEVLISTLNDRRAFRSRLLNP